MKFRGAITLCLVVLFFVSSEVLRADDDSATGAAAKSDTPRAAQVSPESTGDLAPSSEGATTIAGVDGKTDKPEAGKDAGVSNEAAPSEAEMKAAIAQAAKLLTLTSGAAGTNIGGQGGLSFQPAGGGSTTENAMMAAMKIDPAMQAAIIQATRMLAQSAVNNPAAITVAQKEADPRAADGDHQADEAKRAARAEVEEAQEMADAAMANASQAAANAASAAESSIGTVSDPLSNANRSGANHYSTDGLIMSAHSLEPDPSDDNHHSMDSLF